jgi:hypothetical protein
VIDQTAERSIRVEVVVPLLPFALTTLDVGTVSDWRLRSPTRARHSSSRARSTSLVHDSTYYRTCPVQNLGRASTNLGRAAGRDLLSAVQSDPVPILVQVPASDADRGRQLAHGTPPLVFAQLLLFTILHILGRAQYKS